jgi:hypothetical protein
MLLTVDNFQFAIGIISGRLNMLGAVTIEQLRNIGWNSDRMPSTNELRELGENYVSTALVDLTTQVGTLAYMLERVSSRLESVEASVFGN